MAVLYFCLLLSLVQMQFIVILNREIGRENKLGKSI